LKDKKHYDGGERSGKVVRKGKVWRGEKNRNGMCGGRGKNGEGQE